MTARETALRALQELEHSDIKSELLLQRMLKETTLERNDRNLVRELVSGTIRYRLQSDFLIRHFYRHDYDKAAPVLKNILRLGLYQLLHLDRVPRSAAVNECVKLARKFKGEHLSHLVNGVLRKISPETVALDRWTENLPLEEQLSIRHSHPVWLVSRWIRHYGRERTESMLRHNNLSPLTAYRLNRLKTTHDALFALLRPALSQATQQESGLAGFFFSKEFHLLEPLLKQGLVAVQNPTQALACLLLNPAPGSTIYDMCAAPGGKATFLAELMNNEGRIIALDRSEGKLKRLTGNAETLGTTIIETHEGDGRTFDPGCRPDAILIDAPCTGTGVLARRAELRWRIGAGKLAELATLQAELLDRAAGLLKPGGTMVYATCSIEPEENELQIEAFLRKHPEFSADLCPEIVPEPFRSSASSTGMLLALPGERDGFDGGFAQRLRKAGRPA